MQKPPRILSAVGISRSCDVPSSGPAAAHATQFHASARLASSPPLPRAKSHLAFELPLNSCLCPCVPLTPVRGLPRAVLLPRPSVFAIKSSELSGPNYWNRRWEGHLENPGSAGLSQAQGLLLPKPFAYSWCWDKGPPASSLPSPFSTQGAVPPGAPVPGERTRITKCMC